MTLAERVAEAHETLARGGVPFDQAAADAEVLAREALGWDLATYIARRREPLPADFETIYDPLIRRRLTREPVSQIIGHREFWGLEFEVSRDVLTPRPETELVVQAALDVVRGPTSGMRQPPVIVDVGTGSGCIAVALAVELPDAQLIASEASAAALVLARRNAARHGVAHRIAFRHTDVIPPENDVDVIVSNPPYVITPAGPSLPREVRDYEPAIALFGGPDGLDFYRRLLAAPGALREGGWLIVEVGYDQGTAITELATATLTIDGRTWQPGRIYQDFQEIDRVLTFRACRAPGGAGRTME